MQGMSDFRRKIREHPNLWKSIEITMGNLKKDDRWISFATKIVFLNERKAPSVETLIEVEDFEVVRIIKSIDYVEKVFRAIEKKKLQVGGRIIGLETFGKQRTGPSIAKGPTLFNFEDLPRAATKRMFSLDWSSVYGKAEGDTFSNTLGDGGIQKLNVKLRTAKQPTLKNIISRFFKKSDSPFPGGTYISFDIITPSYARLERFDLEKDRLEIKACCDNSISHDDIYTRIYPDPEGEKEEFFDLEFNEETLEGRFVLYKCHLSEEKYKNLRTIKAELIYRGEVIDKSETQNTISLENLGWRVYEAFDGNGKILKQKLSGNGSDVSTDFENAISQLFHFAGFSPLHLGDKRITGEIDVLALTPDKNCLVAAECTVQKIDKKISPLVEKIGKLREKFKELEIIPVIFTSLPMTSISNGDLEKASQERICVISKEKIDELLEETIIGISPEEFIRKTKRTRQRFTAQRR
ncbi:hypothetical protein BMS3Bbin16_00985 [archaeon BMS3Bbin16]|nr:hypothetical protein BMS3Bbin16_00985 [archaeon BMS3Bbin16]